MAPNFQQQMPQSMSYGNNYLDQSLQQSIKKPQSTQEQLDMKYRAYSISQPEDGVEEFSKMRQSSQGMPLHSPSYTSSRNPSDGYMGNNANSQQTQFPFEKFNPQNQNLGPTQIFYQGPQNQPNTNQNPNVQSQAQLAGQQQQTQMLLLELLRQNSISNMTQQQNQQIQQQLLNQSIHNPSSTPPTNPSQPLFGQGFLSASQILASTGTGSQPNSSTQNQNLNQTNQHTNAGPPSNASSAYPQNFSNVYSYLNNNQSMVDQIERSNPTSYQNNQSSMLKVSPRKASVEVDFGQQNNFEYKNQPLQQFKQDQSFDPSFNNAEGRQPPNQMQNNYTAGSNLIKKYENLEIDRHQEPSMAIDHATSIGHGQYQLNESLCGTKMSDPRQNEGQQYQQYEDDSADIVWPSAHRKSKGIAETSRAEPQNDGISWVSKVNQQKTDREDEWENKPQQLTHQQSFSGKNFNSQGEDSGFNLNRSQRNDFQATNQALSGGRVSDRSATPVNIDDLPVPAKGAKTFEQLLEEKIQDGEVQESVPVVNKQVPKKQFLKRKSQAYAPPKAPAKQYKYYTDAFESKEKAQRSIDTDEQPIEPKIQQQNQAVQNQAPPRPQPQRQRVKTPHLDSKREEQEKRATTTSLGPEQPRTNTTQMTRKPFLKRGTGTAGGQGRMANQKNKQSAPKIEKQSSANQEPFRSEQNNMVQRTNRESIDEFEQIEKNVTNEEQRRQNSSPGRGVQNRSNAAQRKKKKLFDDSDSDDQQNHGYDNMGGHYDSSKQNDYSSKSPKSPGKQGGQGPNRSNLVNKMFYKDQNQPQQNGSKKQLAPYQEPERREFEVSEQLNEQMQDLLNKKQEELEKAIDQFNAQNEQLHAQKLQYDQMIRKVKLEQREIDQMKKRQNEDVEKMKEDAMQQIKKEKKALEQRQKNFQLVSTTAKREREEIDQLRREFNKYKADAELKAKKQTSQINALTKQNNELKQKNRELTEDLRALDAQRIALERSQPTTASNSQMQSKIPRYTGQGQSRYSFQQQNKSGYNLGNSHPQQDMEEEYDDQQQVQDVEEDNMYGEEVDAQGVYQVDEEQEELENDQQSQGQDELLEEDNSHGFGQKQVQQDQVMNAQNVSGMGQNVGAPQEEQEEDFGLKYPREYHAKTHANSKVVDQIVGHDGKIQRVYASGKKEVIFNNGVKRESWPDGYTIVYFSNADIKQTFPDQKVVYYFAEAQTTQTTFPDKLQVFKFSNNQIEKHFPDKTKEIIFPDGTIKCIFEDGDEESIFPDGTIQKIEKSGIKTIEFANGQKDILYPDGIRVREFPDGKVRKTYPDGRSEVFTR